MIHLHRHSNGILLKFNCKIYKQTATPSQALCQMTNTIHRCTIILLKEEFFLNIFISQAHSNNSNEMLLCIN